MAGGIGCRAVRSGAGGAERARPTPVTRSIKLGTRPFGFGAASRIGGVTGTAGWVSGTGRAGPASTGLGAMKAPPRIATLSAAAAACGTGSLSCSARAASRPASSGGCAAFWVSTGWV